MAQRSAGLLIWRSGSAGVEFLLAHPGGPFWRGKDLGAWTIPKGLINEAEDSLAAARREFAEETGLVVEGALAPLTPVRQKSGKIIEAWLVEADLQLEGFCSNLFSLEWPRRSGRMIEAPEIDEVAYFAADLAAQKILAGQRPLLQEALAIIGSGR